MKPTLACTMFCALMLGAQPARADILYSTDPASTHSGNFSAGKVPGLVAGDVLVAFSFGYDNITPNLYFTVDREAIGAPNTAVNDLSSPMIDGGANGDIFYSAGGSGSNSLNKYGTTLGLTPGFLGDNITGFSLTPQINNIYFTLSPGSPTLTTLTAFPDDILESSMGKVSIYEQYSTLGLGLSTDQVTGLDLNAKQSQALFTISQFSPDATTSGGALDPAAVYYTSFKGSNSVYRAPSDLGLISGDQIQDIKSVPEPSPLVTLWLWYAGLAVFGLYRATRMHMKAGARLLTRALLCRSSKAWNHTAFLVAFAAISAGVVRLDAAETCSTMAGTSPPVSNSAGTLILPDLGAKTFRWVSNDVVFGAIDTGVIAAKTFTVSNTTPPRVVFTGTANGLNYQGSVLLGTYQRGTVNVYNATKIVSYLIAPPKIQVTNIEFDWKSPTQSKDPAAAITLRQNLTTPLAFKRPPADPGNVGATYGEWVTGGVNDPALYVANQMVSIKARFTSSSNFLLKADISAKGTVGNIPAVSLTTVNFNAGVANPQYVQMALATATPDFISKYSDTWQWQLGNLNGCGTPAAQSVTTGPHTLYTVLAVPTSPWYDNASQQPWVTALDYVNGISEIDDQFTLQQAAERITNFVFSGNGLIYDTGDAHGGGRANYTVNATVAETATFNLTGYISSPNTCASPPPGGRGCNVVNCYDQAAAVSTLFNLVGGTSAYRFMQPNGYMATEELVGRGQVNNPFYDSPSNVSTKVVTFGCSNVVVGGKRTRSTFGNHAFVTLPGDMPIDAMGGPYLGTGTLAAYLTGATSSIDANPLKAAATPCTNIAATNGKPANVRAAWRIILR